VLLRGAGAALLAALHERAMGAGGGARRFRPGAPVLVLLLIAAAALPRRALAVTDAADGNVPCFALLASLKSVELCLLTVRAVMIGVCCSGGG